MFHSRKKTFLYILERALKIIYLDHISSFEEFLKIAIFFKHMIYNYSSNSTFYSKKATVQTEQYVVFLNL